MIEWKQLGVGKTRNETKRNETAKRNETGSHTLNVDSDYRELTSSDVS